MIDKYLQDLAWSCLPIQYKEALIKEYKHRVKWCTSEEEWSMESFFGKHNLNADIAETIKANEAIILNTEKLSRICQSIEDDLSDPDGSMVYFNAESNKSLIIDLIGEEMYNKLSIKN